VNLATGDLSRLAFSPGAIVTTAHCNLGKKRLQTIGGKSTGPPFAERFVAK
jgi:hypothetical protein